MLLLLLHLWTCLHAAYKKNTECISACTASADTQPRSLLGKLGCRQEPGCPCVSQEMQLQTRQGSRGLKHAAVSNRHVPLQAQQVHIPRMLIAKQVASTSPDSILKSSGREAAHLTDSSQVHAALSHHASVHAQQVQGPGAIAEMPPWTTMPPPKALNKSAARALRHSACRHWAPALFWLDLDVCTNPVQCQRIPEHCLHGQQ